MNQREYLILYMKEFGTTPEQLLAGFTVYLKVLNVIQVQTIICINRRFIIKT